MRLAIMLSMSLIALAFAGCDSPETNGTEDPSRANLEPPTNPDLCRPACELLTGTCEVAAVADDDGDVEILRGCIEGCLAGDFTDDELECLAESDCTNADVCLE